MSIVHTWISSMYSQSHQNRSLGGIVRVRIQGCRSWQNYFMRAICKYWLFLFHYLIMCGTLESLDLLANNASSCKDYRKGFKTILRPSQRKRASSKVLA